MPVIEVNGVVTREVRYGENSRILTVLAEDAGKISVLAGRARTNRSGLLTATQLFSYSNFSLFKGRENSLLKLNEGMPRLIWVAAIPGTGSFRQSTPGIR